MKALQNQHGLSLVELLALLVISSIMSVLVIGILVNALNTEKKVKVDTQLREEADFYMASLINTIYTMKESEVCREERDFYFETDCSGESKLTGFLQEADGSTSLYVDGRKLSGAYSQITIDSSSRLSKKKNIFTVMLVLNYNGKSKTFHSEIQSILN